MLLCLCPANFRGGGPGGTLLAQGAGAGSPAVSGPSQCQAGLQPELEGVKDSCAQSLQLLLPSPHISTNGTTWNLPSFQNLTCGSSNPSFLPNDPHL